MDVEVILELSGHHVNQSRSNLYGHLSVQQLCGTSSTGPSVQQGMPSGQRFERSEIGVGMWTGAVASSVVGGEVARQEWRSWAGAGVGLGYAGWCWGCCGYVG